MKISQKLATNIRKTDQNSGKVVHVSLTCSVENKAQRLNGIVRIWADRAEMKNPVDFVKKQRISRF
jgi:predicted secreted protein